MAISLREAIYKVGAMEPNLQVVSACESLDAWIVSTAAPGMAPDDIVPGLPMYLVNQNTGEARLLPVGDKDFRKYITNTHEITIEEGLLPYQDPGGEHAS